MSEIRKGVMSLMRKAIEVGQSRTSFLKAMKAAGTTYLGRQMIADWTQTKEFHDKAGALSKLRRNAYPSDKSIVTTDWDIAGTYMYVCKVKSRLRPEDPLIERMVNITTDTPMTGAMMEQAVVSKWVKDWEYEEEIEEITPWTAIRTTI
ncbi:hypothetical protein ES705_31015 [subsurface metagenome]